MRLYDVISFYTDWMNQNMLHINDLTIEYADGKCAVNHVGLCIAQGENVALIGANGAGKTSLLLPLVGILPIKTGSISVDGMFLDKKTIPEFRRRVGLVFQNPDDQLFMPTVFEDVAFGLRSYGYNEDKTAECAHVALEQLQIQSLAHHSPLKLSGGEKRLAAIAAVLAMKPDFLLFDEPTAFLDPRAQRNLQQVIKNLPQGKLIATHDLSFVAAICSRVVIIKDGKIAADNGIEILANKKLLESSGL